MAATTSTPQTNAAQTRKKDKSFRHVFKGSVLINTLLDYDEHKFHSRLSAVKFAQRLLDIGQVESIGGGDTYEDSAALYRWCDESVVREAKRIQQENQCTTATHIPRKKIIELIDLQQSEQGETPYTVDKTRTRLASNNNSTPQMVRGNDVSDHHDNNPSNWNVNNNNPLDNQTLCVDPHERSLAETDERKEQMSPRIRDLGCSRGQRSNLADGVGHVLDYDMDPLEAWVDRVLENKEHFETVDDFERQTSNDSDVFVPQSSTHSSKPSTKSQQQQQQNQQPSHGTLVRYDGINMPALDLDNLIFERSKGGKLGRKDASDYPLIGQILGLTTEEGSSFSDNEKQLLQQMRQMQDDHQVVIEGYDCKIKELVTQINALKGLAEQLDERTYKHQGEHEIPSTPSSVSEMSTCPSTPVPPLAPPAPPPPGTVPTPPPIPPQLGGTGSVLTVKGPTKRAIQPTVKMRPLFWNRILLPYNSDKDTFWHFATEPVFDVDQFERLFGRDPSTDKKDKSLHDTMSKVKATRDSSVQKMGEHVKLLEDKRSRLVAIKLKSLHCSLADIKQAAYKLDFSRLDVEQLNGLHEIRGTEEEMAKINAFVEENPAASLDEPESFLLEMTKMAQFTERIECLTFRKNFNESLFDIDQQLDTVQKACKVIRRNRSIKNVLELTLALGNYMNGSTHRGQADAFDLGTLAKLRDVKSMDNSTTLLRYIVAINTCEYEAENAGKNEAVWKFPDLTTLTQASQLSFTLLTSELKQLRAQIHTHSRKADIVALNSKPSTLQPFKDQMDDFFDSAETMLKGQVDKLEATKTVYQDLLKFMAVSEPMEKMPLESFFGVWSQFLEDYKSEWKLEQKDIAKKMFEKVESQRKERMRTAKRRKSTVEDGKSNLKQKFSLMRQKTDSGCSTTVKLLRSHSISAVDVASEKGSCDHHKSPSLSEEVSHQSHDRSMSVANLASAAASSSENAPRVRSRTRQKSLQSDGSSLHRSNSSASGIRNGESMIERMQKRRRNRQDLQESASISDERSRKVSTVEMPNALTQMSRIGARLSEPMLTPSESIKERMQRRRRERDTAVNQTPEINQATPTQPDPGRNRLAITKSVDLASLRQKFVETGENSRQMSAGMDGNHHVMAKAVVGTDNILVERESSVEKAGHCKQGHDKACDHLTCQAQKMTRAALRSTSQEHLNSTSSSRAPVSKHHVTRASAIELRSISQDDKQTPRRRRDSYDSGKIGITGETELSRARRTNTAKDWKGSQQSLPESDSSSRRGSRSRLGSRESWKGSHQSVQETSDNHSSFSGVGRETKSSILRREAGARAKRDMQQSSVDSMLSGGRAGWRGSQSQLSGESDSKRNQRRRESSEDIKTNEASVTSTSGITRRMRDRSHSQQSVVAPVESTNGTTKISGMRRARDAWRGSQPTLSNNNTTCSSNSTSTSTDTTSAKAAALRRVLSNASASNEKVANRRELIRAGRGGEGNSAEASSKLMSRSTLRGSQSSLVEGSTRRRIDSSKSVEGPPSESDYKDDLRKLSRTRTSLITVQRN